MSLLHNHPIVDALELSFSDSYSEDDSHPINVDALKERAEMKVRAEILSGGTGLANLDLAVIRQSKSEIIDNALKVVCESLNVQVASIFLISKDGSLERSGIYGIDINGSCVNGDSGWFEEESYTLGKGFTGKVVPSPDEDAEGAESVRYGEIHYAPTLDDEDLESSL